MKFWTLERQLIAGFVLVALIVAAVGAVSWRNAQQLQDTGRRVAHTYEVIGELTAVSATMTDAETGMRGYVLTGQAAFLEPYDLARQTIATHLQRLRSLTSDNPEQQRRLQELDRLVENQFEARAGIIASRKIRGLEVARQLVSAGADKVGMDALRKTLSEMQQEEQALLRQRQVASARSDRQATLAVNVFRVMILALVLGSYFVTRRHLVMRNRAEQELRALNTTLEDRVRDRTAALESANGRLQESEARLKTIVEHLSEGVAVFDLEGRMLHFNRAALQMYGFASLEDCLQSLPEFAALLELSSMEGDVWTPEQWPLARIMRGESLEAFEARVRHLRDGWQRIFSYSGSLVRDAEGRPLMAVVAISDITTRKQAEQRLRQQLEHLNLLDHITRSIGERLDLRSIFQVVIRTLEDSLPIEFGCICLHDSATHKLEVASVGIKSGTLVAGLALTERASVSVDENGLGRCMRGELVYEPDIRQVGFPFPQRLVAGGLRSLVMAPLRSESRVFGVLVAARRAANGFDSVECEFLRQLSEHVALAAGQAQLHGALQQAYDDLRQTQQVVMQEERLRALGQMASGIAHDINNALSPVSLYTESMLESEPHLSARARSYLETIQRAVEDVAQTVARMREFYRQREIQLDLAPVDVNLLAQQVLDLTRARWSDMPLQHGITIQSVTDFAPDLPKIMGVESEIREALTNLVFNAVDAMPQGGTLTLRTRLSAVAGGAGVVLIEVADNGIGMDEETRVRCLEPFFTTKGERGTGLGLAMVFGAVQRHSATLEIESAPGRGTTMRLLFGVPSAVVAEPGQIEAAARPASRLRLLLIDDDPVLLKSLHDALEADGHVLVTANGGAEGVAAFRAATAREETFAAVITDLGMPYVDGRKVSASVKEASPGTPVIMLTGWGQRLVAEGDIPPHVDRVLAKPPKLRELREALAQLCRSAAV